VRRTRRATPKEHGEPNGRKTKPGEHERPHEPRGEASRGALGRQRSGRSPLRRRRQLLDGLSEPEWLEES
jgi:hypothetical protein